MGILGSIFKAVPVVGDILSANSSKKAAKKAAAAQTEALNKAITALNQQFGISATNLQPSINAGNNAIGGISDLLGLGSSKTQSQAIDNLKGSPLYQALFGNGLEALKEFDNCCRLMGVTRVDQLTRERLRQR